MKALVGILVFGVIIIIAVIILMKDQLKQEKNKSKKIHK